MTFFASLVLLRPLPPQGNLGMTGSFTHSVVGPRTGLHHAFEKVASEVFHAVSFLEPSGVEVHILLQEFHARGGGHDFDGRDEWKIGDASVSGDEENHVATAGGLPRNRLYVVPRRIHKEIFLEMFSRT